MGGGSKEQTVGYKYYLGMQMVLCHGPIDAITRILIDNKVAWNGSNTGGQLYISNLNLFGGEGREGGVAGYVDIDMGGKLQPRNTYLQGQLGSQIPAFRGVVSAVLRQVYLGMNPYIKPWAFLGTRINTLTNGDNQWLPDKAAVGAGLLPTGGYLFFGLDASGSMQTNDRIGVLKNAMGQVFDQLEPLINNNIPISIRINAWGNTSSSITRYNISISDLNDIRAFVNAIVANQTATNFTIPVNSALTFFRTDIPNKNLFFFVTDGGPSSGSDDTAATLAADMLDRTSGSYSTANGTAVDMYGINIDLVSTTATAKLDNTPEDGVPVINSNNISEFVDVVLNALSEPQMDGDINPAHIIRECITDNIWGMGYQEADIDDVSFTDAANTLHIEGFGLSILWDRQNTIESFIGEILKHIDGSLRVNPRTGLFELKLVRNDYQKPSLLVLDATNISKVEDYSRKSLGELVNTVTVQYWDRETLTDASVTIHDIALIQVQGASINTTLQYPAITKRELANRVAQRDLKSLSVPLVSCKITAVGETLTLSVGDIFTLNWPEFNIFEMVMRVSQVNYSDDKTHTIKIQCSQDTYDLPATSMVISEQPLWQDISTPPIPADRRYVYEMPYYEAVRLQGQNNVDGELSYNNYGSVLAVSASSPQDSAFNADFHVDMGAGLSLEGVLEFSPSCIIENDINPWDEEISYISPIDIDNIGDASWGVINNEIVAIDSYDEQLQIIYVRRGIFDTVPQKHLAGSVLMITEDLIGTNFTSYVDGDILDVAITPSTSQGPLLLADAPIDTLNVVGRLYRPYRPGNVRVANHLWPEEVTIDYPAIVSWSHRNRIAETAPLFTSWNDGDITPETGTEYRLVIDGLDGNGVFIANVVDITTALTSYEISQLQADYEKLRITLSSVRGTFVSYQSITYVVNGYIIPPYNVLGNYAAPQEPTMLNAEQL